MSNIWTATQLALAYHQHAWSVSMLDQCIVRFVIFWSFWWCQAFIILDHLYNIRPNFNSLCTKFFIFNPAGFFSMWVLFHEHSRITGLQGKREGISLTPHYHFHPLHRHLDISRAIAGESSPLHITSSWTQTRNLWFSSASC